MEHEKNQDVFKETILSGELIREFDALDRAAKPLDDKTGDRASENLEELDFSEDDLDLPMDGDVRHQIVETGTRGFESIGAFLARVGQRLVVKHATVDQTSDLGVNQFLHGLFSKSISERNRKASSTRNLESKAPLSAGDPGSESIGTYFLRTLDRLV